MSSIWQVTPRTETDVITQLLKNRGIEKPQTESFLNPSLSDLEDPHKLPGVDMASERIKQAIKKKEKIIIYGDYDVDGITATAVLWEAINKLGGEVLPYIPNRFTEGYGINNDAIKKMAEDGTSLIISVDAGVTAVEQISLAKKLGIDFIVTDHHTLPEHLPDALSIVHTTELAGVGVAYKLAQTLIDKPALEFVALGTIADIVPLTGENRILAKFGIDELKKTIRPGLLAIYEEAGITSSSISTYQIGFIIDPRLNAMGRMEHALDSLRILLTRDASRARELARKIGETNRSRIQRTMTQIDHARKSVENSAREKLWVISDSSYEQGIIGLVAGRLSEEWSRPVIAISEGAEISKGSARSVEGFSIVDALASTKDLLLSYGGHPQAAGFTIETKKIPQFRISLQNYTKDKLDQDNLNRKLLIDTELKRDELSLELARKITSLDPFGVGNKEPLFVSKKMKVGAMRLLSENRHLKVELGGIEGIGFGLGVRGSEIRPGMYLDVVFHLEENKWKDRSSLQLKLRDFKVLS